MRHRLVEGGHNLAFLLTLPSRSLHKRNDMKFNPSFLDEIRARVPVSEVVALRVKLRKQGREWRGLSPFGNEKTPSFYVNDQKGFFHDFSSGKHGDGFGFLMETEGLSFPEAVERLAAMAGLAMPVATPAAREQEQARAGLLDVLEWAAAWFEQQLQAREGAKARGYLADRGLRPDMQVKFRIGYAPPERFALREALALKGARVETMNEAGLLIHGDDIPVPYDRFRDRVMFPICDRAGKVIAFGGRALNPDAPAKYLNSPETPLFHKGDVLFNHHNARKAAHDAGSLVAVEGYVDAISLTAVGVAHVVAPLGTALGANQLELMWKMAETPILCFDGDKAGRKAAHRALDIALPMLGPGRSLRFALLPEGQDPDDLARASGRAGVMKVLDAALPLVDLLWQREAEQHPLGLPDERAAFERRLHEAIRTIGDEVLRRHYQAHFDARLAKEFGAPAALGRAAGRPAAPRGGQYQRGATRGRAFQSLPQRPAHMGEASLVPVIGAGLAQSALFRPAPTRIPPRVELLLLILMRQPALLEARAEEIAGLDLGHAECNRLRDRMVILSTHYFADHTALEAALDDAGFAALRQKIATSAAISTHSSASPTCPLPEAERAFDQALALHGKSHALHQQLRDLETVLGDPALKPEEFDAHFERLCQTRELLMSMDGMETSGDDVRGVSSGG